MTKSGRQLMEILEAFDLTQCAHAAAKLTGVDPKTVARYVAIRDAGGNPFEPAPRSKIIDPYLEKIEELVERSHGKVRADVVHDNHLVPMGFGGDERTTRLAVAAAKEAYDLGHRRTYRPWVPEPGMWAQYDWAKGPEVCGRPTCLFCAWVAWSRFRVVIPTWDRTLPTTLACVDAMLRRFEAAPTYLLTENVPRNIFGNYDREHPAEESPGGLEAADDVFGGLSESRPDELMAAEHRGEDEPVTDPALLALRDEAESPEIHLQLDPRGRVIDADRGFPPTCPAARDGEASQGAARDDDAVAGEQDPDLDNGEVLFHPGLDGLFFCEKAPPGLAVAVRTVRAHLIGHLADQLVGELALASGAVDPEL